ncbi:hypothetical protein [Pleomorphomonas carboxyditropha]|uniref:Uncharacterized protein n=1 Tax=Pleomorphomonas carboxyditropha TaxID=2023338 RepID=A0A2G9WUB6_9HYPH|nr:hypothetical protein [Pleomorphomonas carboxyditropha]PIO98273.1 hypothetical protein CJ014_16605 [Pleomorphomonas carboxyditropha]
MAHIEHAARVIGLAPVTAGALKNNYVRFTKFFDAFPKDLIGTGDEEAPRKALLDWGGGSPIKTDIDGQKKFFRDRSWQRSFFERSGARPGDQVVVEELAPYSYRVTLRRAGGAI